MITAAPALTSVQAIAWPIPELAPVIKARCPATVGPLLRFRLKLFYRLVPVSGRLVARNFAPRFQSTENLTGVTGFSGVRLLPDR